MEERDAIVAWLHRRAAMCDEAKRWWRPFHKRRMRVMGGTFGAAAKLIERDIHYAEDTGAEARIIRAARLSAPQPRSERE